MENLPTFVLHSTKKRSIWRFLLLAGRAGCVSSCNHREPLQQLWAGAPSQLWPHLPPHTCGFLLLKGSFCIFVSCSLSSCGCSSSCGQARPFAGFWSHLSLLLWGKGGAGDPRNVPRARGAVHGRWSLCTWGPPCAMESCSPAGQRWKAQLWRGSTAESEQLEASTALCSFLPSLFLLICFLFLPFFPFLSWFPSFGFAFKFIFYFLILF